jgi:hypothetical protein
MGGTSSEELLEQWKQFTQQGMEAWLEMLGGTPRPDVSQYWMPFFHLGVAPLAQLMSQRPSPELLQFWKQFLDQGVEAWAKALEHAMASEGFASTFGKYLDQYLRTIGPAQQEMKKAGEAYLRALGLPSRTQIGEMASQITWVESRIEELEAKIDGVLSALGSLQKVLEKGGPAG